MNTWTPTSTTPITQEFGEVMGFHPDWVHPDWNPNGTRIGFLNGDDHFNTAKWCDYHDKYENDEGKMPTHFMHIPTRPDL
jgi:hypothetical protein